MRQNFHEHPSVGWVLTFIGGMVDSFTYMRYKAFASAQTGNLILAIIESFEKEWSTVEKKLLSTVCFVLGLLLAKWLKFSCRQQGFRFWRLGLLYLEALTFLILGSSIFIGHATLVTMVLAFITATQWIAFDKINGRAYTNLFTTGNLKGLSIGFFDFMITRTDEKGTQFFHYLMVVLAFLSGVGVSVYCYAYLAYYTLKLMGMILLLLSLLQTYIVWRSYRKEANILGHHPEDTKHE